MLAALLPVLAAAQGYYDASKKPDGDGTARSPYQIATLHNLLWIAQQVNGGIDLADTYLVQTQDIDCSPTRQWDGGHGWAAIGGMQTVNGMVKKMAFRGHYDGQGHAINQLYVNRPTDFQGLFGYVYGGSVRGLRLNGAHIEGTENLGVLTGYAFEEEVTDCHVAQSTVKGSGIYLGGLMGYQSYGTTRDCTVDAAISGYDYLGGIVSWCVEGTVSRCHATGKIASITKTETDGSQQVGRLAGGLVGYLSNAHVDSCSSSVEVVGGNQMGGLVGVAVKSVIAHSYAAGNRVKGITYVGGLVGKNEETAVSDCFARSTVEGESSVGGLIGSLDYSGSDVARCYAAGQVTATNAAIAGGLVGNKSYTATVKSCYYDKEISQQAEGVGGFAHNDCQCEAKTTAQMKVQDTYAAAHWDFARVWAIDAAVNEGYPHLVGVGPAVQRHGDIDGDGTVNVSDVTVLINCVLGSASYSLDVSDIDGDGTVNVSDVTALINLVLNP